MSYSAAFERAIKITLANEGGYVDNPNDPGGATNFGLSQRTYPNLDIRDLTVEQATAIYYRDWWAPYPYDQMTFVDLACKVFDTAVNMGVSRAVRILQHCVAINGYPDIGIDGVFGPQTLQLTNTCDGPTLLICYRQSQANYYRSLVKNNPNLSVFLQGWLNRAAE